MASSQPPPSNDFVRWVEEKSDAVMADLSERFPPATSGPQAVHAETSSQRIEEVLMGHEQPKDALLDELAALENAPPLSDAELERQALEDGGGDADPVTPE